MADYYDYSSAAGTGSGADWTNAFTVLATAISGKAAGDRWFVADDNAESGTSGGTLSFPGTAAAPNYVLCTRRSGGSVPPVDADLRTTGVIATTGANPISFAGYAHIQGLIFQSAGGGANAVGLNFTGSSDWHLKFLNCSLQLATTSASQRIAMGASSGARIQAVELANTSVKFASTSQAILVRGAYVKWSYSTALASGSSVPALLFVANTSVSTSRGRVEVRGVDFSGLGANTLVDLSGVGPTDYIFIDCKTSASTTLTTGTPTGPFGSTATFVNCDSGNTQIRYRRVSYSGTETEEATIVRSGGASDGTTSVSRKMVSSSLAKNFAPLSSEWMPFWFDSAGSFTANIYTVTDNVTLTDADMSVETEYQGTSGFPLGVSVSDASASVLATPANQTTDTSTWTTTGLTTPVKQVLSVSFTTTSKGVIWVRVNLSKASTTVYFDPKPLSASSRQWMAGSGLFVNEGVAAGGSAVFPAVGTVFLGTTFGPTGADYTGTRTDANRNYVIAANGNYGDPGAQLVPRATIPAAGDVDSTAAAYGVFAATTTPTFAVPAVTNVASGVQYGAGGTEFTGTYSGGGGGVTLTQLQSVIDVQTAALESNLTTQLGTQTTTLGTNFGSTLTARGVTAFVTGQDLLRVDVTEINSAPATGTSLPTASDNATATAAQITTDHGSGSYVRNTEPPTAAAILAAILAGGDIDGLSMEEAQRILLAAVAGLVNGAGTGTVSFRDQANGKNRIHATTDARGNRSAVTLDATP